MTKRRGKSVYTREGCVVLEINQTIQEGGQLQVQAVERCTHSAEVSARFFPAYDVRDHDTTSAKPNYIG